MKNKGLLTILSAGLMIVLNLPACKEKDKEMKAPAAEIKPTELVKHEHIRVDNYFWMKDRDSSYVLDHLKAENAYTEHMMRGTDQFQDDLYEEMLSRIKQTDNSVPYLFNEYFYYTRYEEGKEHPVYCRKNEAPGSDEEIMLNVNDLAEGHAYFHIRSFSVTPDNKTLAWSEDTVSRRKYTVKFKNLKTGDLYEEQIANTSGKMTWANDNKTVFVSLIDETLRPYKIIRCEPGTNKRFDVYEEEDSTYNCYVYKTKSQKYLVIGSSSTLSDEYRILNANNPAGRLKIFERRHDDMLHNIDHYKNKFIIRTNLNAKNFYLAETPENRTGSENWKTIIPHRDDVLLEKFELFSNFLVAEERKEGLTQFKVIDQQNNEEHYVDFGEETYSANLSVNLEINTEKLRFNYTSFTTPISTFDYDMSVRKKELLKEQEVLGDFNKNDYKAERVWAEAPDGTKIPVSLVYKKSLFKKDGNSPLWLEAYGSYGISSDVYFSSVRLSLLNRGFVYAVAHVRGGQEMGRYWYDEGKLLKKKNTFTDFIACTEYLQKENYTSVNKTFAWGASAGGLLIGAVLNMKPEIFKGVIAPVPFVDLMTTMLDESIPLTTSEYDEWGNPNEKIYYDYMLSYSPYDNVESKGYPNILVTAGYHDPNVQYWEPAKWVAKLRALKTDNNLLLLHTNMDFGHGGASGRFERLKETALEYAFVFKLCGIND